MNTELMFSHKSDMWSTPQDFFNVLNEEFNFTLDPCATSDNAKCVKFFTPDEDGLTQSWAGERVFCNPPYSDIKKWVEKAHYSIETGAVVVMLVPARTDTRWFHDFIYNKYEIRFIKGRLKFGNQLNSAPFPSMVVIFR